MGKILSFENYRATERYTEASLAVGATLQELMEKLATAGLNLAMAGVWRDWDAQQPDGATLHLDLDDLRRTDDPVLTKLMELYDLAEEMDAEMGGETR